MIDDDARCVADGTATDSARARAAERLGDLDDDAAYHALLSTAADDSLSPTVADAVGRALGRLIDRRGIPLQDVPFVNVIGPVYDALCDQMAVEDPGDSSSGRSG